ncbi:diaminopimelate decarboxylase [Galactobacter caseinivorans]|uniref:Diaminopimelate decarboxylase n=1 Tax=Galactobacter caseinivorans TaxID=2676123 RepID=A0A496PN37_9MICC|nr:diaminopimelate decarboxylase [Galactobacter caseinivorans]RKW71844.1 diaminopimelate decarboxylase [Galactobacter caseinivorans]
MTASPLAPGWLTVPADLNELRPQGKPELFPASAARTDQGELSIGGVGVAALAAQFGTPLYVVDEADLRARARSFKSAYDAAFAPLCGGADVYYAGKVFLNTSVARWVSEEGLRLDTASGGELAVALAAGVEPANIGLHGNNKSDQEIERALSLGLGRIIADSLDEVDRLAAAAGRLGLTANVMLRLTPGVHASTHEFIATAHEDQKFGLSMVALPGAERSDAAEAVRRCLDAESVNLLGLHCHIGSQIFEAEGFGEAARRLITFLGQVRNEHGVQLPELDLGGGYGIAYTEQDRPSTPERLAAGLADVVSAACQSVGIDVPRISIEPGRAIAGPAGITLYGVGVQKDVQVSDDAGQGLRRYVAVDGGMSDNARPVLYDADYSAILASRSSGADAMLSRVVGKHCESGDIVVRDVYLPADLRRGDLLAVPATGAYCWSLGSNYNYLPRPAVVAVLDGQVKVMVRGETETDLLSRDTGVGA